MSRGRAVLVSLCLALLASTILILVPGTPALASSGPVPSVVAGGSHGCLLTSGGAVKCWGDNSSGQVGDGTTLEAHAPQDVSGLSSGVFAISAGQSHSCALTSGGGVKCWGSNTAGQLGDNTTTNRSSPVTVNGLAGGVSSVSAGGNHTCAVMAGGSAKCWGSNTNGQLGDNSTTNRSTPVDVSGLSGVSSVSAGGNHTCALNSSGTVRCWGSNGNGQLGDNTFTSRSIPVDVQGLAAGTRMVAAGASHTCALTAAGGVKCWGANLSGQLGDNTISTRKTPTDVYGLSGGVRVLSAGGAHTCALTSSDGLQCWGNNAEGQLGDGSQTSHPTPEYVPELFTGTRAVSLGGSHSCATTNNGQAKCWGGNGNGQLGDGTSLRKLTPIPVRTTSSLSAISTGGTHTCGISAEGGAKCWGENSNGRLGDNSTTQRWNPVDVSGLTSGVTNISAGNFHTCARTTGGSAKCWGHNGYGQLGDNSATDRLTPVDVSGLASGVTAVSAATGHTCALTTGGGVKCWGFNGVGALGDGSQTNRQTPVDVSGLSSGVTAISTGGDHTCALTTGGGVKCWGFNGNGQLGDNSSTTRLAPVDVSGLSSGVTAISAGTYHTCALTTGGGAKCWGNNNPNGQLGDNSQINRLVPVDVSGLSSGVTAISAGLFHTCAFTTSGGAKCWGNNNPNGQLGDNSQINRLVPVDVSGLSSGVTAISADGAHTCALSSDGKSRCWGYNASGQLGDSSTTTRLTPVFVYVVGAPFNLGIAPKAEAADFNADGKSDVSVYRANGGIWYLKDLETTQWGGDPSDKAVPADYNGDRAADIAFYRADTGTWYIKNIATVQWGGDPSDVPVPGDYDGDGDTDFAVWRKSTGTWYVKDRPDLLTHWGGDSSDVAVPADYDGDGDTDFAVWRKSTGTWYVQGQFETRWGGDATDVPVPADYDKDGDADLAVWRKSTGTWYVRNQFETRWGGDATDVPVPADYDKDGDADLAVWRRSTGTWYVQGQFQTSWGGDVTDKVLALPSSTRD